MATRKTKTTQAPELADPLAAIVDELGALEAELAPIKSKISRSEFLRDMLRKAFVDRDALEEFQVKGARYIVVLGARAQIRSVSSVKAAELLGDKFPDVATVSIGAIEKAGLPFEILAACTSSHPIGPRSLRVFVRTV